MKRDTWWPCCPCPSYTPTIASPPELAKAPRPRGRPRPRRPTRRRRRARRAAAARPRRRARPAVRGGGRLRLKLLPAVDGGGPERSPPPPPPPPPSCGAVGALAQCTSPGWRVCPGRCPSACARPSPSSAAGRASEAARRPAAAHSAADEACAGVGRRLRGARRRRGARHGRAMGARRWGRRPPWSGAIAPNAACEAKGDDGAAFAAAGGPRATVRGRSCGRSCREVRPGLGSCESTGPTRSAAAAAAGAANTQRRVLPEGGE